jgi:cyclic beta-1,2-glucan synthetase
MLTNGRLGYIASDCGTGHMWHTNARELKITQWINDPLATRGKKRWS